MYGTLSTQISAALGPLLLTLGRAGAALVFALFFLSGYYGTALFVFVLAAVTDYFDGECARRFNQCTPLGEALDPLADKVLCNSVVLCLLYANPSLVLLAGAIILVMYDASNTYYRWPDIIKACYGISMSARSAPSRVSKWKTAVLMVALPAQLAIYTPLVPDTYPFMVAANALFVLAIAMVVVSWINNRPLRT